MTEVTDDYKRAKQYAVRRLAMQAMLTHKLVEAMHRRAFSQEAIDRVISELSELGLFNDAEWSSNFVKSQSRRKLGPRAIAMKLASKGVRGEALDEALNALPDDETQQEILKELLSTRYARRDLTDPKERQKVVASLVRRGFALSVILDSVRTS